MNILDGFNLTPITIYNRYGNSYKKTIINDCLWRKSTEASFKSQGTLPLETSKIYVTNYHDYKSKELYDGKGWTITLGSDKNRTYIVKGSCEFNFDSTTEIELSKLIREFESKISYSVPKAVSENIVGVDDIEHLLILC